MKEEYMFTPQASTELEVLLKEYKVAPWWSRCRLARIIIQFINARMSVRYIRD